MAQEGTETIKFDGLDSAFLGFATQWGGPTLAVYDEEKIITCLEETMTRQDAMEYYEYNIMCLYAGPGTPMILENSEVGGGGPEPPRSHSL